MFGRVMDDFQGRGTWKIQRSGGVGCPCASSPGRKSGALRRASQRPLSVLAVHTGLGRSQVKPHKHVVFQADAVLGKLPRRQRLRCHAVGPGAKGFRPVGPAKPVLPPFLTSSIVLGQRCIRSDKKAQAFSQWHF